DFPKADCGYGVGQITDGMTVGSPMMTSEQKTIIALDYAANIAKAVQMLTAKWNELDAAGMHVNNGDPKKIENWFFAVWTYNTGFYSQGATGAPWGVGWYNNPINPIYPPRSMFMSDQTDAAHPQDWPYPEKVIGWAAY